MPITSFNTARIVPIDTTDDFATATASGYFDGIKDNLNVGDLIILTASDDASNVRVTAINPNVTVENTETNLPANSVFDVNVAPNANINGSKIAVSSMPGDRIIPLTLTGDKLADNTITGPKIGNSQIAESNLTSSVITKLDRVKLTGKVTLNSGINNQVVAAPGALTTDTVTWSYNNTGTASVTNLVANITANNQITFTTSAGNLIDQVVSYTVAVP
jgi:hypothetical protein